jgi:hypothetical protein
VLEPFASQLGYGDTAGASVAAALTAAGFTVDVLRDDAVTVPVMQHLSDYSVVYMETHSNTVDNHGFVLTGDQNADAYTAMRRDCAASNPNYCALMQGFAGNDVAHLYNAITDRFVDDDVTGTFPGSSIIFINGCDVLGSPSFWAAFQAKNAGVLVSWDNKVDSAMTEPSADRFFGDLGGGMTVADAVADVTAAGLGTSVVTDPKSGQQSTAHLGFLGDGSDTLERARAGAPLPVTVTPTATPKPTSTPKPKPTATPVHHKTVHCKKGYHKSHGKCVKTKKKKKKTAKKHTKK